MAGFSSHGILLAGYKKLAVKNVPRHYIVGRIEFAQFAVRYLIPDIIAKLVVVNVLVFYIGQVRKPIVSDVGNLFLMDTGFALKNVERPHWAHAQLLAVGISW